MFTEESIQKVRDVDIMDVISSRTKVTKGKACCPIHNEKTPSLSIKQGYFKCFGCGAGGDAIKFIQLLENVDFMGAVELLAKQFNIALEYARNYDAEAYARRRIELKSLRDHLQYAQLHFTKKLAEHDQAMKYITDERGYNEDIIMKWGLGFAPDERRLLTNYFLEKGVIPQAVKLGVVKENEEKNHYDTFRNRIIFPIVNEHGELLTFAGRHIGEKSDKIPKYINGAQSELYNKSAVLYGLYQAKAAIKKEGFLILTEGYTDVISMHAGGAENTVGSCGTSLTDDHAKLIKKHTSNALLMRDGDAAGEKATSRDIEILIKHGVKADVLQLEDGKDPDNFAKQYFTHNQPTHEVAEIL